MRTFGPVQLTDSDYTRLLKLKAADGFKDKDWTEWLKHKAKFVPLEDNIDEKINKATEARLHLWMLNFSQNLAVYRLAKDDQDIREALPLSLLHNATELLPAHLKDIELGDCQPVGPCVLIGRGPSVWKHHHLETLRDWAAKNPEKAQNLAIMCTDGMVLECLRNGVTPDMFESFYALSVDGDRKLIVRWFGDPDDPQDSENIKLFDDWAKLIKLICASTVANNVVRRCLSASCDVYMFHPIFDDAVESHSFTRMMMLMTDTPHLGPFFAVHTLGNAGALGWVISFILLRRSPCLMIGMDFGYLPETKVEDTSYTSKALAESGDLAVLQSLTELENPYDHVKYKTDAVFMHYRKAFIDTLDSTPPPKWVKLWNCSEGGCLWGHRTIEWKKFSEALNEL